MPRKKKYRFQIPLACLICLICIFYGIASGFVQLHIIAGNTLDALLGSSLFYSDRIISQAVFNLDNYIYEYKLLMTALSKTPSLIQLIEERDQLSTDERLYLERQCMIYLKQIMTSKPGTAAILIVGSNGYLYTNDARSTLNTRYDFIDSAWFQDALAFNRTDKLNISAIQVDFFQKNTAIYGQCATTLSFPIRNYSDDKIGVIYCFLDPSSFKNSLYLDGFEDFGGVFLVNSEQKIVLHNDTSKLNTQITGDILSAADISLPNIRKANHSSNDNVWVRSSSKYVQADAICSIPYSTLVERTHEYQKPLIKTTILCMLMMVVFSLLGALLFHRSSKQLIFDLQLACSSENSFIPGNYHIEELNEISKQFSHVMEEKSCLTQRNYDLQLSTRLAKLNTLVSQMNPHFLFNALQLLQTELLCNNPDKAEKFLVAISSLLRYSVDKTSISTSLKEELDFCRHYLDIFSQTVHYPLTYHFYYSEELLEQTVPKFLIQPVVENCLRHGFRGNATEASIQVIVSNCGESYCISIIDNGNGIASDRLKELQTSLQSTVPEETPVYEPADSVGLINIQHRIRLLYGPQYGLSVSSVEKLFTKIDIFLPRKEAQHADPYC